MARAAAAAADQIAAAVDAIVARLQGGGRLIYVGAGTAGRLGLLDAVECPPTFNTDQVVGVLAGGDGASTVSAEAVEDDATAGARDLAGIAVGAGDAVVGIAASGRTPYTLGAVAEATRVGAVTVGVSCNPDAELSRQVDYPIEVVVGPEFITGSTRLKAGSAQKLVLNALSTVAMVRLGKTYGDLMVDLRATNVKLRRRAQSIVCAATGADPRAAEVALTAAGGSVKTAIVMLLGEVSVEEAERRLRAARRIRPRRCRGARMRVLGLISGNILRRHRRRGGRSLARRDRRDLAAARLEQRPVPGAAARRPGGGHAAGADHRRGGVPAWTRRSGRRSPRSPLPRSPTWATVRSILIVSHGQTLYHWVSERAVLGHAPARSTGLDRRAHRAAGAGRPPRP